jgi:hypothetical protein
VKLTEANLKEISDVVPIKEVATSRSYQNMNHLQWKFANMRNREEEEEEAKGCRARK